ncbi:MAG: sulfurtransferase complex subunit TusB [Gammaproteobacteria bacterium]|nr:sulfurtransferase complex subunit TusB [Gammaproteobacteria bacterium]
MLHIINKSPFERNSLESCLRTASKGSTLLFIEDGVYAALEGSAKADTLRQAMQDYTVCVLEPDLAARGIAAKAMDGIKRVDYAGFVDLVAESERVQSWL